MSIKNKKLIIDNNSLIYFFNYYYFDRDNDNKIYKKLKDFLYEKLSAGEIIIIDKVFEEFQYIDYKNDFKEIKKRIKPYVVDTKHLLEEVEKILGKHYLKYNEKFGNYNESQLEVEKNKILNGADLFLVALCKEYMLSEENCYPIIVSEESRSNKNYNKLVKKIPNICKEENIEYIKIPYSLFNVYKDELNFKL